MRLLFLILLLANVAAFGYMRLPLRDVVLNRV
jgi:hypothetical protein